MWPPDLNPIDFPVWSLLKAEVYYVAHPSVDALKTSPLSKRVKILQETLCALVGNFKQSIKRLVKKKGNHTKMNNLNLFLVS